MSESESDTADDSAAAEETGGASQDAPNQSVQQQQQTGGGTSVEDFVSEGEQVVIKEWLVYVTGLFAALGVAVGLNGVIQDFWEHSLISYSGQGTIQQAVYSAGVHASSVWTFMTLGIFAVSALGILYARHVDNEEKTAYKVGAATGIAALPVLLVVSVILYTLQLDNWDPEFVNLVVSGLGAGIAAAVGSAIVIWLTENQAPEALN